MNTSYGTSIRVYRLDGLPMPDPEIEDLISMVSFHLSPREFYDAAGDAIDLSRADYGSGGRGAFVSVKMTRYTFSPGDDEKARQNQISFLSEENDQAISLAQELGEKLGNEYRFEVFSGIF